MVGAHNGSAIATLAERSTRYLMLVPLEGDHTAETVRDGLARTMGTFPTQLRGSLAWDQGAEMARRMAFSLVIDMGVYFCDPHSPWQRGSTEDTNGMLRCDRPVPVRRVETLTEGVNSVACPVPVCGGWVNLPIRRWPEMGILSDVACITLPVALMA